MKRVYTKNMTIEEIENAAHSMWAKLNDVEIYLNKDGKVSKETHSIIADECLLSKDKKELKKNILEYIKKEKGLNEKVKRNLKNFAKIFLEEQ